MSGLFAALAGRDTFTVFKPHPDHLRKVVLLAGGDPARSIMVGDTSIDVATARAAAVPVIACSFGYPDMPVEKLAADRTIGHFGRLPRPSRSLLRPRIGLRLRYRPGRIQPGATQPAFKRHMAAST